MAKFNKKGEMKGTTIAIVLVVALLAAYAINFNGFKDYVSGFGSGSGTGTGTGGTSGQPTPTTTVNCPSTGTTSLSINVQDELATTATNVDSEYYVFNGNKLIKEGTTGSDGADTISLTCGQDFKILLVNTTTGNGNGLYPKAVDYSARIASDSLNARLVVIGTGKILGIENPADPSRNANVSIGAGATKNFELKFVANHTARGFNRPTVMCQVNVSAITDVSVGTFSDGTPVVELTSLPKRVSATSGFQYYAFEYPKMLTPSMGVVAASGSLTAGATAPSTTDSMSCIIVDNGPWKTASYKAATTVDEGFKTSIENTETNGDVGGPDTPASTYAYTHSGGY